VAHPLFDDLEVGSAVETGREACACRRFLAEISTSSLAAKSADFHTWMRNQSREMCPSVSTTPIRPLLGRSLPSRRGYHCATCFAP
jgi:hypothetical protein